MSDFIGSLLVLGFGVSVIVLVGGWFFDRLRQLRDEEEL